MNLFKPLAQSLGLGYYQAPEYQVIKKVADNIEIRKYDNSKWVCCSMESKFEDMRTYNKNMFHSLFDYINGKNEDNQRMQMTIPVTTVFSNSQREKIKPDSDCNISMRFYVPKDHKDNMPNPLGPNFFEEEPDFIVASIQFGGFASIEDFIKYRDKLISALGEEASKYDSINMITAIYDAPYKPLFRKNEVWLRKFLINSVYSCISFISF